MTAKAIKLPEPFASVICYTGKYSTGGYCAEVQTTHVRNIAERLFTADQMCTHREEYAAARVAEVAGQMAEALERLLAVTRSERSPTLWSNLYADADLGAIAALAAYKEATK